MKPSNLPIPSQYFQKIISFSQPDSLHDIWGDVKTFYREHPSYDILPEEEEAFRRNYG